MELMVHFRWRTEGTACLGDKEEETVGIKMKTGILGNGEGENGKTFEKSRKIGRKSEFVGRWIFSTKNEWILDRITGRFCTVHRIWVS